MTDDGILPLDVAIISADPLWSAEAMNAVDRALGDARVSDYLAPAPAREEATPGRPAVFVVGPDLAPALAADPVALTGGQPGIALLFAVWDPSDAEAAAVRAATGEDPLAADDTAALVARVQDRLLAMRTGGPARPSTPASTGAGRADADAPVPAPDRVVLVTGGSGGTGRTTVAVNLAAAITERTGRPVALLDAHGALGDIPLLLGIPASTDHDLDDFAIDATTVTRFTTHDPDTGVAVVVPPTGGSGYRRPTAVQLVELLVALEPSTDVVIVDAPLDLVVDGHLAPLAAATVLVTTTRTVHLKNVLVAADLLERPDTLRLVVNEPAEGHRPGDRHAIERAVGLRVDAALPFDADLDRPDEEGRPRVRPAPRSKLARAVADLADALVPAADGG